MSFQVKRILRLAGAVALFSACTGAADTATQDDAALKASTPEPITQQQIEQNVQGLVQALRSGDAAPAASFYADDAVFVSARGKVETSANIGAFWTEAIKGGAGKNLELHLLKWGTSGDLAWTLSHYVGGVTAPTGHVLAISQRQPDGTLKTVAQISIPEAAAR